MQEGQEVARCIRYTVVPRRAGYGRGQNVAGLCHWHAAKFLVYAFIQTVNWAYHSCISAWFIRID
jgi:hypothetical protein